MRPALILLLLLNLADLTFTVWWLETSKAIEDNPLMAIALEHGPVWFAVIKTSVVMLGVWVLWRHRGVFIAKVGCAIALLWYITACVMHVRQMMCV